MGYPCKEYYHPITSKIEMIFYCVVTSLVIIPGVLENAVVVYTIISKPRLHTPAYCLNAALAISDLSISFIGGSCYLLVIAMGGSEGGHCVLKTGFLFVHGTLSITTALLLVVITRDRYLSFKNITSKKQHATVKKNIVVALACFFVSMMLVSTLFIELYYSVFSGREIFAALLFTAFVVIAIYYQKLRKLVKKHAKVQLAREETFLTTISQPDTKQQRDRRSKRFASVNASIVMLVGSYAFAYLPFAILFAVHTVNQRIFNRVDEEVSHAFVWANSFGYLNAVVDPLIYAFRCDPIGKELRKVLYRVKRSVYQPQVGPQSEIF
eukprot:Seg2632.4 transcript_id=Seg2632.4/GoldUCD/mRNA.D3Y31 product="Melanocyte-stimulating hormone receptor" protein_id=Seg2632.4/GoldUCD/D3Y31